MPPIGRRRINFFIQWDTNFKPIIEAIKVDIKNKRQKVAGSLNTIIPISTVPTAPMPVHTAYAVPIGITCVTLTSKYILMAKQIRKPMYQYMDSVPAVSFALPKQVAKTTSNNPAITNKIQFKPCAFYFSIYLVLN